MLEPKIVPIPVAHARAKNYNPYNRIALYVLQKLKQSPTWCTGGVFGWDATLPNDGGRALKSQAGAGNCPIPVASNPVASNGSRSGL
jgi:hypothetical protein